VEREWYRRWPLGRTSHSYTADVPQMHLSRSITVKRSCLISTATMKCNRHCHFPMLIDTSSLPTHLATVGTRLNVVGPDSSADTFLASSYLAEAAIKTIAVVLQSGLSERRPEDAYRFAYSLIRADGLGMWERAIYESSTAPLAAYLPPAFQSLVAWLTKKRSKPEDEWIRAAKEDADTVLRELGVYEDIETKNPTVRALITELVQIRNKTKAHGAVTQDFYASSNAPYFRAIVAFVNSCPAFRWRWAPKYTEKRNRQGCLVKRAATSLYARRGGRTVRNRISWHPLCPRSGPRYLCLLPIASIESRVHVVLSAERRLQWSGASGFS
jgi:hypothetical protein